MATGRRVSRIAALIKKEVSQILLHDIKDDRVGSGMVSITDVEVSGDLQHAKIFVSIYGSETARQETMEGLRSAKGYVRSYLGQRIRLRRTPEIVFIQDRSLERGDQILSLINQVNRPSSSEEENLSESDDWEES
ncbi:MAG: 30S ribosome-binding factor RbfA [Microcoleaceae cyanobacterium]